MRIRRSIRTHVEFARAGVLADWDAGELSEVRVLDNNFSGFLRHV